MDEAATKRDLYELRQDLRYELISEMSEMFDNMIQHFDQRFTKLERGLENVRLGLADTVRRSEFDQLKDRVEALERKSVTVTKVDARREEKCGKCGAPNKVKIPVGQTRAARHDLRELRRPVEALAAEQPVEHHAGR